MHKIQHFLIIKFTLPLVLNDPLFYFIVCQKFNFKFYTIPSYCSLRRKIFTENQWQNCHQLNQNVQTWSTGVLQWITNSVTDNGSLVNLWTFLYGLTILDHHASLNVFLSIVPGTSGIWSGDGHLNSTDNGSGQETEQSLRAKEESEQEWSHSNLE